MKRYYSSESVRNADRVAHERFGLPANVLMENAGRGAAEAITRRYPGAVNALILCGRGNNGGDGFVAARHLRLAGITATVISVCGVDEYKNEAAFAAKSAMNIGINITCSGKMSDYEITSFVRKAGVIVDALLGTGSSGPPRGEIERLIRLSASHSHVVALDIPSGINADTGEAAEVAVTAEMTVTFLAEKPGLVITPGSYYCGEVALAGIGVPPDAVINAAPALTGWDASDIPGMLPLMPPCAHKTSRGSLLIIGGSSRYRGAPILAAMGALRAGCGLVALAVPESVAASAAALLPEAILVPLPEKDGHISFDEFPDAVKPCFEKFDAAVLGPGIGRDTDAERASAFVYAEFPKPAVIDADALRFKYGARRAGILATPHAGEAAHILGISPAGVEAKRLDACAGLAEKFGTALLKGPHTLISDGREVRAVLEGGPELAVPGSGDVLSGIIGAFLASGMTPLDAATCAAVVHGVSGSLMAAGSADGLLAREIANGVKDALRKP